MNNSNTFDAVAFLSNLYAIRLRRGVGIERVLSGLQRFVLSDLKSNVSIEIQ